MLTTSRLYLFFEMLVEVILPVTSTILITKIKQNYEEKTTYPRCKILGLKEITTNYEINDLFPASFGDGNGFGDVFPKRQSEGT